MQQLESEGTKNEIEEQWNIWLYQNVSKDFYFDPW